MTDKKLFTQEDCIETGYGMPIANKVIVLKQSSLPEEYRNPNEQLYFCKGGNGSNPNPIGRSILAVSLSDGELVRWNRSDVLGILKPQLLPDSARLHLSQIRPSGALDLKRHEPEYSGYSFLPDGRYAAGVWLCNEQEVKDYIVMQKDYQYRVMICDRSDFCVFEMKQGVVLHPSQEIVESHRKEQEHGGMKMDM